MGLSLGGALAAILTCLEPRFAFSIPLIAHMDLDALVADAPVLRGTRRDLRRFGWRRQDFAQFVADLGWYDLRPQLPPDRIHLFAASDDRFFDPKIVRKMWHDWKPAIRWYPSSHMGFLPHLPSVFATIRAFINRLRITLARPGICALPIEFDVVALVPHESKELRALRYAS